MNKVIFIIGIVIITFLNSCEKENFNEYNSKPDYKIAVMLPLSGPDNSNWNMSSDWVLNSFKQAENYTSGKLRIVWFNTYEKDIISIAKEICEDSTILAAIGPLTSSESFAVAPHFIKTKKPLMLPTASSADISSAFSGKSYIWRMVESDISQCQALLIIAKDKGAKSVALVTGDDPYGITFYNWFGFLATEMDLKVTAIEKFDQALESPNTYMESALSSGADLLIAIPKNTEQALAMANYWIENKNGTQILFSDAAYLSGFLKGMDGKAEGMEGTAFSANPETGFDIAFRHKYGTNPTLGMAQIYDALTLLGYGLEISKGESGLPLANALMSLSDAKGDLSFWDEDGIERALKRIAEGDIPKVFGASGRLKFDDSFYTDIISSTYVRWQIYNNEFLNLSYYTSDGEGRVSRLAAAWQYYASKTQVFDTSFVDTLPERDKLWALIVATSQGWSNYRHQADALRIYHNLKSNGLDDSHIVLCMADDIAYNSRNPYRGTILDAQTNENLYADFELDYNLIHIDRDDLLDILSGVKSTKVNTVIEAGKNDNILVYFIGHGDENGIIFQGSTTDYLSPNLLKETLDKQKNFRRMLICIESCYSGVFEDCHAIPSVLFITAANRFEPSKPVVFNSTVDAWLSNQFTNAFYQGIKENPNYSFSELYLSLNKTVYGSHVSMFNAEYFGNVYEIDVKEFIIP